MGTSFEPGADGTADGVTRGTALAPEARPRIASTAPYQRMADDDRGAGGESLADFLGLFSIGLGLAEVVMPGVMAKVIGVNSDDARTRNTMRLMGVREITHGLGLLSNQRPAKWAWSRVAGDALDLAFLGKALTNPENDRTRTAFAVANVLAVTALDLKAAKQLSRQPRTVQRAAMDAGVIRTKRSITVNRPVEEVYAAWRDFEQLPQFMRHLESVTVLGETRSRWRAKAPAGASVEWEAEITNERENEVISWRSVAGSDVENAGTVRFREAPGGRGTEVRLELEYHPPFGKLGSKVAMLWREEPGQQAQDDLRHFKQYMELGEIVVSDATKQRGPHAAQPDDEPVAL